jgi:hypothetical protein
MFVNTRKERGQSIIQVAQDLSDMALTPGECPQNTFPCGGGTDLFPKDGIVRNNVQEPVCQLPDRPVIKGGITFIVSEGVGSAGIQSSNR